MALGSVMLTVAALPSGCSNDFLWLQDYQRDLIFNGLAVALLLGQQANGAGQGDGAGGPVAGNPIPGPDGPQGPQGPPGPPGADGADGVDGVDGADGVQGPQGEQGPQGPDGPEGPEGPEGPAGPQGPAGPTGPDGAPGADGPEFFDVFVDEFFTSAVTTEGDLQVVAVPINEPVLTPPEGQGGETGDVGYRVAIPSTYQAGQTITKRLFLYRFGQDEGRCFALEIQARRLTDGATGPECWGGDGPACTGGRRWIVLDDLPFEEESAGEQEDQGVLIVVDIPLNHAAGLDLPDEVLAGDLVAFEIHPAPVEGLFDTRSYQVLGVEFFAGNPGDAALDGATAYDIFIALTCDRGVQEECGDGCPECVMDEDCDDENLCNEDTCDNGTCVYAQVDCGLDQSCDPQVGCEDAELE